MNTLSEFQIALVYYSGLGISMLLGILGVVYLQPKEALKRIFEKSGAIWSYNFITTVLIAALLGAMSISFTDCRGNYSTDLDKTLQKGIHQISTASLCLSIILAIWFIVLIARQISKTWEPGKGRVFKVLSVVLAIFGIAGFYLALFFIQN